MIDSANFSDDAPIIQGIAKPYPGWIVGYAAIIEKLPLQIPLPAVKAMISLKYRSIEIASWLIFCCVFASRQCQHLQN